MHKNINYRGILAKHEVTGDRAIVLMGGLDIYLLAVRVPLVTVLNRVDSEEVFNLIKKVLCSAWKVPRQFLRHFI